MSEEQKKPDRLYSWQEGMPTAPDVAVLQKTFTDLKPGDRIAYEQAAEAIGSPYGSQRFRTVTTAWRKREKEKGIVIDCDPGSAFIVLTADQISGKTHGALQHIGRTARKQRSELATIRAETDDLRRTQVHQMTLLASFERDSKKARMNLLPSTETKAAPRIAPPAKTSENQEAQA